MARIHTALFLLVGLFSLLVSAAVPTFCKCTCFTNSTIIPLGPQHDLPPPKQSKEPSIDIASATPLLSPRAPPSSSCAQCNRAFCLRYNLPICKDAEEKDVTTMCFQRDSRKDQVIVWGFILGTVGLLAWAAGGRLLEMRNARSGATRGQVLPGGWGPSVGRTGAGGPSTGLGWMRFLRHRGSPAAGGGGLSPLDDRGRGSYSPLSNVDDGEGHGPR